MKAKLKNYKKYKERNKEHELDLNNQVNQMHGKCLLLSSNHSAFITEIAGRRQ